MTTWQSSWRPILRPHDDPPDAQSSDHMTILQLSDHPPATQSSYSHMTIINGFMSRACTLLSMLRCCTGMSVTCSWMSMIGRCCCNASLIFWWQCFIGWLPFIIIGSSLLCLDFMWFVISWLLYGLLAFGVMRLYDDLLKWSLLGV